MLKYKIRKGIPDTLDTKAKKYTMDTTIYLFKNFTHIIFQFEKSNVPKKRDSV